MYSIDGVNSQHIFLGNKTTPATRYECAINFPLYSCNECFMLCITFQFCNRMLASKSCIVIRS